PLDRRFATALSSPGAGHAPATAEAQEAAAPAVADPCRARFDPPAPDFLPITGLRTACAGHRATEALRRRVPRGTSADNPARGRVPQMARPAGGSGREVRWPPLPASP